MASVTVRIAGDEREARHSSRQGLRSLLSHLNAYAYESRDFVAMQKKAKKLSEATAVLTREYRPVSGLHASCLSRMARDCSSIAEATGLLVSFGFLLLEAQDILLNHIRGDKYDVLDTIDEFEMKRCGVETFRESIGLPRTDPDADVLPVPTGAYGPRVHQLTHYDFAIPPLGAPPMIEHHDPFSAGPFPPVFDDSESDCSFHCGGVVREWVGQMSFAESDDVPNLPQR